MEISGNKNGKYAMSWRVSRPTKPPSLFSTRQTDDSTHGVGRGRCGDHLAATLLKKRRRWTTRFSFEHFQVV